MGKSAKPRIKTQVEILPEQWDQFAKCLPEDIRLIAEAYRFAAQAYAEIGLAYTLKELLLLAPSAVNEMSPSICLYRVSTHGSRREQFFLRWLPLKLGRRLIALSRSQVGEFLFSKKNGKPFTDALISRAFSKASEKSKIRIYPLCLRVAPMVVQYASRPSVPSCAFQPQFIKNIPEDKIKEIESLFPSKEAGRPSIHDQGRILQVLLAQLDFNLSRKQLATYFPDVARAAESRKRGWIELDIWNSIIAILDR